MRPVPRDGDRKFHGEIIDLAISHPRWHGKDDDHCPDSEKLGH